MREQTAPQLLSRMFKHAVESGKRVRTETDIGENAVSISYAAVELAKKVFDSLDGRTILVLGAGKMSELTAKHLVSNGVKKVIVTSDRPEARKLSQVTATPSARRASVSHWPTKPAAPVTSARMAAALAWKSAERALSLVSRTGISVLSKTRLAGRLGV